MTRAHKNEGTVSECLAHLAGLMPAAGTRQANEARKPLAEFVQVNPETFREWLSGRKPLGLPLLRLKFLLNDVLGYTVVELKELAEPFHHVASLIAYNAVGMDTMIRELSFPNEDSVMRLLRGGSSTSPIRLRILADIWDRNRVAVEASRTRWRDKLENLRLLVERSGGIGTQMTPESTDAGTERAAVSDHPVDTSREAAESGEPGGKLFVAFSHSTCALAAMTEQILELPSEKRRGVLQQLGRDALSRLATNLERIANE